MALRFGKLAGLVLLSVLLFTIACTKSAPPAPPPPASKPVPPAPATAPTQTSNGSIRGKVLSLPPGFQEILPLTAATADNPENAEVAISGSVSRATKVEKDGSYFFTDLPSGKYQLTASARWYVSQTRTIELPLGRKLDIEPFVLDRGKGVISGRIQCGGKAVSNATLRATNVTTAHIPAATYSKPDGSYSLAVPAGRYIVFAGGILNPECSVLAEAHNKTAQGFVVEPGDSVTHDIILQTSPAGQLPASSWQGTWSYSPGPGQDFARSAGWPVSGNWKATFIISDGRLSGSQTGIDSWEGNIEGQVTGTSLAFTSVNRKDLSGGGPVDPQDFVVEATISGNTISGTFRDKIYVFSGGKISQVYELAGTFTGTLSK